MLLGGVGEGRHLLHVGLGVLVRHDFDGGREEHVAAGVITVRMRVDDVRHRLVGDRLDLIEDCLPVVGELRVDEDHTAGRNEGGGIPALAGNHVEVVGNFFDGSERRLLGSRASTLRRAGLLRRGGGENTNHQNDSKHETTTRHIQSPCQTATASYSFVTSPQRKLVCSCQSSG